MLLNLDGRIGSWNAFSVPRGTELRYVLGGCDGDDISLVFGGGAGEDELTIDLPASMAGDVIVTLQSAIKELRARGAGEDSGSR